MLSRARQEIFSRSTLVSIAVMLILFLAFRAAGGGFAAVSGKSMEPLFHSGDLVALMKRSDLKKGDIIVFKTGNTYVIHRIIYVYEHNGYMCYVTQGDNNPLPDVGDRTRCPLIPHLGVAGYPEDAIVGAVITIFGAPLKIPYLGLLAILVRGWA